MPMALFCSSLNEIKAAEGDPLSYRKGNWGVVGEVLEYI